MHMERIFHQQQTERPLSQSLAFFVWVVVLYQGYVPPVFQRLFCLPNGGSSPLQLGYACNSFFTALDLCRLSRLCVCPTCRQWIWACTGHQQSHRENFVVGYYDLFVFLFFFLSVLCQFLRCCFMFAPMVLIGQGFSIFWEGTIE